MKIASKVQQRLHKEAVIWLTTVSAEGQPQASPVWFLWDGKTFLIYSKPGMPKLLAVQRNPKVALNLNSDADGGEVVTLEGTAEVLDAHAPPKEYMEKYREAIFDIKMTPESFTKAYSVPMRVTSNRVRSW